MISIEECFFMNLFYVLFVGKCILLGFLFQLGGGEGGVGFWGLGNR